MIYFRCPTETDTSVRNFPLRMSDENRYGCPKRPLQAAAYSWTHKSAQEAYNAQEALYGASASCANDGLYESGIYTSSNGCINEGVKDAFAVQAEYNLAYNAHLYLGYLFTNKSQDNTIGTGLDFAF